jgi:hypothetical protein
MVHPALRFAAVPGANRRKASFEGIHEMRRIMGVSVAKVLKERQGVIYRRRFLLVGYLNIPLIVSRVLCRRSLAARLEYPSPWSKLRKFALG